MTVWHEVGADNTSSVSLVEQDGPHAPVRQCQPNLAFTLPLLIDDFLNSAN